MDIKNLAENVASFLSKHSGELRLVGSALETIVSHLPIDAQDKERLLGVTDTLQKAAGNIANGAAALAAAANSVAGDHADGTEVVISKADVEEAVADYMQEHGGATNAGNANV
jgi:hypothetical protein